MPTHFSSFSFPITAHFSLIFEPIRDQICLLYPFLRSIHFQILMLLEISMLQGTFSPGYLGEPTHLQENRRRLHDAFIIAPDLLEAYEALQFFHDIQASSPFSIQSEELREWIRKYASSRVEEIRSAACTIRHWRSYIQNSWKYGKSNGLSEGLNNKIKVLKRVSFGLHSFDAFRRRILLTCGKLRLSQDPFSVLENAKVGKEICL